MAGKFHISQWSKSRVGGDKKPAASAAGRSEKNSQQQDFSGHERNIFEKLVHTSPDILFVLNTNDATVKYLNDSCFKELPGLNEEGDFYNSIKKEDREQLLKDFENFVSSDSEKGYGTREINISASNGQEFVFSLCFSPLSGNSRTQLNEWLCQARNITTEKKNIKAAQDSRLKLQMALDGSNMGIWSFDPESQKMDCDERACAMLGLTREEIQEDVGKVFSRIHPEDRNFAYHIAFNTLLRKGRFNHELRVINPDLSIVKHIAVVGELITNENAELSKVTGVCMDISQHKLAENKEKTNETFLEESQRIAKIGGFEWDLLLDKVNMTRQLFSILEISANESFSLEYFYSRVLEQDLPKVKETIKSSVKKGKPFSTEFRYLGKNGKEKILWAQALVNQHDRFTRRIIGTIQDITEKREKEKALNTQNLLIKSILDHLPVIIIILDKKGIIKSLVGPNGLGRLGMVENEKVGQSVFETFPAISTHLERVLNGETVNFSHEVELGSHKLHLLSFFFFDAEQELAIGFNIDITAQKKAEAAFLQISAKNQELERMNKVMDMFVYAVAHDLKNPVNNLEMLHQLMLDETLDPEEQKSYQNAFRKSVKRLKQTIAGLIEIIELENSPHMLPAELEFQEILENVQADLLPSLKVKKGKIETHFNEPKIFYNQAFLTSILKNLVSNAIKYSKKNIPVHITITTERRGNFVLLTVKDNGIGIDLQQYGKNLFKPFKRFNPEVEGTGVGLHLIRNIIEKNGGNIQVESKPGGGTTFYCFLKPTRS